MVRLRYIDVPFMIMIMINDMWTSVIELPYALELLERCDMLSGNIDPKRKLPAAGRALVVGEITCSDPDLGERSAVLLKHGRLLVVWSWSIEFCRQNVMVMCRA